MCSGNARSPGRQGREEKFQYPSFKVEATRNRQRLHGDRGDRSQLPRAIDGESGSEWGWADGPDHGNGLGQEHEKERTSWGEREQAPENGLGRVESNAADPEKDYGRE